MFSDKLGHVYRPKDREYRCQDGEYVRRPDGRMFLIHSDEKTFWAEPVKAEDVPKNAFIIDLVKSS